jgi:hypothetical protein
MGAGFSMIGFYAAVLLNVPLALLLLALYRRAVVRAMGTESGAVSLPSIPPAASPRTTFGRAALVLDRIDASIPLALSAHDGEASDVSLRRAAFLAATAGLFFALVITIGWHLTLGGRFYSLWFLWWVWIHAWPVPLAVGLVIGAAGRDWLNLIGVYGIVLIFLSAASLIAYENLHWTILGANALSTLLIAAPVGALLYRPIRAAGMLVFIFALLVLTASPPLALAALSFITAQASAEGLRQTAALLMLYLLGTNGIAILAGLSVTIVTGALAWWTLRRIGGAYQKKRLSDRSIALDSLWAVAALSHVLVLSTQQGDLWEHWAWIVFPITAFVGWWLAVRAGFAILARRAAPQRSAPLLLLLRVFSLGKRSERLFDVITPRWLQNGSIALIAGPDLATGTVQPHHFLEFLARRIRRLFIKDESDVRRRLAELDRLPDPDGRYRVNPFFCFAETWQNTVRRLAGSVDAVLMDLRGFSKANRGCLYELQELLEHVPVARILLIVDGTTDELFLEATLQRLWSVTSADSPNHTSAPSRLRVVRLKQATAREARRIVQLIAAGQAALPAHELQDPCR